MSNMDSALFLPSSFFLVRTPLFPIEYFFLSLSHSDLKQFVCTLFINDAPFREAIAIASPTLYEQLTKNSSPEKVASIATPLLKYFLRMVSRSTPFGLFSFVSWGKWGKSTEAYFSLEKLHKRSRPDMEWLFALIHQISTQPDFLPFLSVQTNPLVYCTTHRIYLPLIREKEEKKVSLRSTLLIKTILQIANSSPLKISELTTQVMVHLPELESAKVEEVIHALISQQFLSLDLLPSLFTSSVFDEFLNKLTQISSKENKAYQLLTSLKQDLQAYDQLPIGSGEDLFEKIQQKMRQIVPTSKSVQVDSFCKEEQVTLPSFIAQELEDAVSALWRMTANSFPLFQKYHEQFLEKYGTHRLVPLLDLLNEDIGLGPPEDYTANLATIEKSEQEKEWRKWLQRKWANAVSLHQQEITISDEVLEKFFPITQEIQETVPLSMDVYCELFSDSQKDLDRGDFLLSISYHAWQGGATFSRFADLFNSDQIDKLKNFIAEEENLAKDCLFLSSSYIPATPSNANVATHPLLRKKALDLGNNHAGLTLSEIYVGANVKRLYITTKEGKKELRVVTDHLLNPTYAPLPLRFIRDVSKAPYRYMHPFSWEELKYSPFLPRIKFKKTILSPAQWNIDPEDICQDSITTLAEQFTTWAKKWKMPRYVFIVEKEQRILIDIHHSAHIQEIVQRLQKGELIQFCEKINQAKGTWVNSTKGRHFSEFVIPFLKNKQCASAQPLSLFPYCSLDTFERWKIPGGEWLFLKLYLNKENENNFLVGELAPFADAMKEKGILQNWFFVRYRDAKNHLRVRFKFASSECYLKEIQTWLAQLFQQNWIHDIQISGYEREIERYGGIKSIDDIESFFYEDTQTALDRIYAMTSKKTVLPDFIIGALSILELLNRFGLSRSDQIVFLTRIHPNRDHLSGFREWKKFLFKEMENMSSRKTTTHPLFDKLTTLGNLKKITQTPQAILASLIHMHCNRLFGLDLLLEEKTYEYALHTLVSWERTLAAAREHKCLALIK